MQPYLERLSQKMKTKFPHQKHRREKPLFCAKDSVSWQGFNVLHTLKATPFLWSRPLYCKDFHNVEQPKNNSLTLYFKKIFPDFSRFLPNFLKKTFSRFCGKENCRKLKKFPGIFSCESSNDSQLMSESQSYTHCSYNV